jgi:uncharacterized small protein (DUF1192 family)
LPTLAKKVCGTNLSDETAEEDDVMALDPFADEPRQILSGLQIGQDLSMMSIDEIDERIEMLEREIERLEEARSAKERSRAAASAFFKLGQG